MTTTPQHVREVHAIQQLVAAGAIVNLDGQDGTTKSALTSDPRMMAMLSPKPTD